MKLFRLRAARAILIGTAFFLGLPEPAQAQEATISAGGAGGESGLRPDTQPVLLQMIRDDSIHRELGLTEDQISAIRDEIKKLDGPWFRVRIRPLAERQATLAQLSDQLAMAARTILSPKQRERLEQLQNQALGTRMIVRDEVVQTLSMKPAQRASLYKAFAKTDKEVAELQAQQQKGALQPEDAAQQIQKLQTAEREAFVNALSNDQKSKLSQLTGPTFNFGSVKRMYPLAPELTMDGAQWLQGTDLTLEDLEGKVVAVHFYAFQCINCRRNLPHYNGWHQDYADKGLVVIGIQTPETSAERDAGKVAQAISAEQIEYPVLMDGKSENWKQYSNTMWPTVYLIDKKGFLRRWWQGEMNWKGTPGEKQMRETIEMLLSEEA